LDATSIQVIPVLLVLFLMALFAIFVYGRIFSKAGYSTWLGLTIFIPLINIVVLIWFAYADWPAMRKIASPSRRCTPLDIQ
jgi:hypothetical protein